MDFKNIFAHLFSLTSTGGMQKIQFDTPKVKVTFEGQMFQLTLSVANFYVYQWISKKKKKNFVHLFSLTSTQVLVSCEKVFFFFFFFFFPYTSKVKVTVEGQMIKTDLARSTTSTFFNEYQNNLTHVFSLTSTSAMLKVCFDTPKVKVTVEGQMFKLTLSVA